MKKGGEVKMIILWIRKKKSGESTDQPADSEDSLQKHNEDIKKFRQAHPKIELKSSNDIFTTDGDVLATVQSVKLAKHTQN